MFTLKWNSFYSICQDTSRNEKVRSHTLSENKKPCPSVLIFKPCFQLTVAMLVTTNDWKSVLTAKVILKSVKESIFRKQNSDGNLWWKPFVFSPCPQFWMSNSEDSPWQCLGKILLLIVNPRIKLFSDNLFEWLFKSPHFPPKKNFQFSNDKLIIFSHSRFLPQDSFHKNRKKLKKMSSNSFIPRIPGDIRAFCEHPPTPISKHDHLVALKVFPRNTLTIQSPQSLKKMTENHLYDWWSGVLRKPNKSATLMSCRMRVRRVCRVRRVRRVHTRCRRHD